MLGRSYSVSPDVTDRERLSGFQMDDGLRNISACRNLRRDIRSSRIGGHREEPYGADANLIRVRDSAKRDLG